MLVGLPDPEHPAIARAAPDRAPHLVGQRLIRDLLVGLGQGAGDRAVRARRVACASRNDAIACSNRRSMRSWNPSNGMMPRRAEPGRLLQGDSGRSRAGTSRRGPARRGSPSPGGIPRARRRRRGPRRRRPPRSARAPNDPGPPGRRSVIVSISRSAVRFPTRHADIPLDRSREGTMTRGSNDRTIAASGLVLLDAHDRFQQGGEHPLAVDARQREGDLGLDAAEFDAEVVPRASGLQGQVASRAGPGRSARSSVGSGPPRGRRPATRSSSRSKTVGVRTCMPKKQR